MPQSWAMLFVRSLIDAKMRSDVAEIEPAAPRVPDMKWLSLFMTSVFSMNEL